MQSATHLLHNDITQRIIGAAFEVHKFLGPGFRELAYQRALALEMKDAGLTFFREQEHPVFYKHHEEAIDTRRADFVVEEKVLVELKATRLLEEDHVAQTLGYLKAYRYHVALLINFGERSLKFRRLVLNA